MTKKLRNDLLRGMVVLDPKKILIAAVRNFVILRFDPINTHFTAVTLGRRAMLNIHASNK